MTPPLLSYPNSPNSAQGFLNEPPTERANVTLDIYQCSACGLVQHTLPPVSYYREVIRAIAFSEEMGRFRLEQLGEWIRSTGLENTRILEIGCGRGEYIELLQRAGANCVAGLEFSAQSVEHAKNLGIEVYKGYLEKGFEAKSLGQFGGFAIFSFMEHWPDLQSSLQHLSELLQDGAVGLVEVPNFEFILKNGLYSEFTTDHIYYFDSTTLTRVLELNGFEVQHVQSIWHDYILSAKVTKRHRINTDAFIKRKEEVVAQVQSFVNGFDAHDVVIWGAGHQALAVMSMANLGGKVSHVIDSAPFKQGLYTPGLGLLIKSPESLKDDRPSAVLIMAAAYSDEVASDVKDKYPHINNVAILRETGVEVLKK
jgi:SAM-dependent methyltransferase